MQHFKNAMLQQAMLHADSIAKPRLGLISGYDPNMFMVKVRLQPEDVETGWLPLGAPAVGNGWGVLFAPQIGDQVEVQFPDGDLSSGVVSMRSFNDGNRPLPVPSGEYWMVHQSGTLVKLSNDGKLTASDQAGSTIVMNGDGTGSVGFSGGLTINANTQINGNLLVSGDISDKNGGKGTLQHIRENYDTHTHANVQNGSGTTSTPLNSL